jgi:hypothetical protein
MTIDTAVPHGTAVSGLCVKAGEPSTIQDLTRLRKYGERATCVGGGALIKKLDDDHRFTLGTGLQEFRDHRFYRFRSMLCLRIRHGCGRIANQQSSDQ